MVTAAGDQTPVASVNGLIRSISLNADSYAVRWVLLSSSFMDDETEA